MKLAQPNEIEARLTQLEKELAVINDRNARVESDKAWETSGIRIASITVLTYFVVTVVLYAIGVANPLLAALVPAIGFFLSMQTMPWIKSYWLRHRK